MNPELKRELKRVLIDILVVSVLLACVLTPLVLFWYWMPE